MDERTKIEHVGSNRYHYKWKRGRSFAEVHHPLTPNGRWPWHVWEIRSDGSRGNSQSGQSSLLRIAKQAVFDVLNQFGYRSEEA